MVFLQFYFFANISSDYPFALSLSTISSGLKYYGYSSGILFNLFLSNLVVV